MTDEAATAGIHKRVSALEQSMASLTAHVDHIAKAVGSLAESVRASNTATEAAIDRLVEQSRKELNALHGRVSARDKPQWQTIIGAGGLVLAIGAAALWPVLTAEARLADRLETVQQERYREAYDDGRRDERARWLEMAVTKQREDD